MAFIISVPKIGNIIRMRHICLRHDSARRTNLLHHAAEQFDHSVRIFMVHTGSSCFFPQKTDGVQSNPSPAPFQISKKNIGCRPEYGWIMIIQINLVLTERRPEIFISGRRRKSGKQRRCSGSCHHRQIFIGIFFYEKIFIRFISGKTIQKPFAFG